MKKLFAILLVCCMAVSMFAGCGNADSDEEYIVIGGIGPITGDYATYGTSVKQGAQLAVDEINEAGGVNGMKLKLEFEDDEADGVKAVNAYATLMDKGMDVSLGATTSGACIAVSEEAKKDGILMITPSGSQVECTQYDNCFRVCFQDPDQGTFSAQFIYDNQVAEKVAVLYDKSNDYSAGICETFLAQAEKLGLDVVTTQAFTDQSSTDFSVQLQAIKNAGAELLFLPVYAQEAAYVLTQAASEGLDVVFFGTDGMDGILEKIGEDNLALTEGVMLLTPFSADSEEPVVQNFVAKYKEAFKATPDQFAADAYDAVYAIKAALEYSGVVPGDENFNEALIAAMTEISVDGTTGQNMTWGADGNPAKTAMAVVITNGTYSLYTK